MAISAAETENARNESISLAGTDFVADRSGALYWSEQRLLVVADLHLEKGSSFARRGVFLPPYDTIATLASLGAIIARYRPRIVIALGDSFHDGDGPQRLPDTARETLALLQRGRDWIWIAGNHDPDPAVGIGGVFSLARTIGSLVFRHEPTPDTQENEIAGHLHPVACVSARGRSVRRRCFATDGRRMVMPAFGAYAGGLNVRDGAFANVFRTLDFTAHMLGTSRLYAIAAGSCLPD